MNVAPSRRGAGGVITSLLAGQGVPFRAFFPSLGESSGEHAGGSGLWRGPPTGLACDASWAAGFGSACPLGSPGYVGWTKRHRAGRPSTLTERTFMSGPALRLADRRSKSRLKLVRHFVARSVSTTRLPGRNVLVFES